MGACQAVNMKAEGKINLAKFRARSKYDIDSKPCGLGAFASVFSGSLKSNPETKVAIKSFEKKKLNSGDL